MKRRALLAGLAAAGLVATLSGCTLANAITPPIETAVYATTPDSRAAGATLPLPSFVPDDAVMIRIKENSETGDAILVFGDGAPEPIGAPCDASEADSAPALDDTWWPQSIPTDGVTCIDGWHIFVLSATQFYGWKS
ncbi:hypothetical protein [Herbiconiux ginsengi]|uniref:Lipoprotein n=1 Tax=Herbiconiux ginsengi TaxID=381665 RepID=A0A1H3JSX7_9MICO|nr:hypothetical protein [Herbiconiux ginsengi]SDY43047.1 hypothetical protein SAMN05216554_0300 [Herbiconiux ginsengi]